MSFIISHELLGSTIFGALRVIFAPILRQRTFDAVLRAHLILLLLYAGRPDDGGLLLLVRSIVFVLVIVFILRRYPHYAS